MRDRTNSWRSTQTETSEPRCYFDPSFTRTTIAVSHAATQNTASCSGVQFCFSLDVDGHKPEVGTRITDRRGFRFGVGAPQFAQYLTPTLRRPLSEAINPRTEGVCSISTP